MSFSATVRQLLVSCPGDVPAADLGILRRSLNRWNIAYGQQFASTIVPVSWATNAVAEFGRHPQAALNSQIVDSCDICIALFANRLGTETPNAKSGTVEEIERLHSLGRYVAVLRSVRPVNVADIDLGQAVRLEEYLQSLAHKALVLTYADDADLQGHVEAVLIAAVSRDSARAELQLDDSVASHRASMHAEIWPRVLSEEKVETDYRGRSKSRRDWYLVLSNSGSAPARNVSFSIEPVGDKSAEPWIIRSVADGPIEAIGPNGEIRFGIFATMGSAVQVRCTVRWDDDRGTQESIATLRLT